MIFFLLKSATNTLYHRQPPPNLQLIPIEYPDMSPSNIIASQPTICPVTQTTVLPGEELSYYQGQWVNASLLREIYEFGLSSHTPQRSTEDVPDLISDASYTSYDDTAEMTVGELQTADLDQETITGHLDEMSDQEAERFVSETTPADDAPADDEITRTWRWSCVLCNHLNYDTYGIPVITCRGCNTQYNPFHEANREMVHSVSEDSDAVPSPPRLVRGGHGAEDRETQSSSSIADAWSIPSEEELIEIALNPDECNNEPTYSLLRDNYANILEFNGLARDNNLLDLMAGVLSGEFTYPNDVVERYRSGGEIWIPCINVCSCEACRDITQNNVEDGTDPNQTINPSYETAHEFYYARAHLAMSDARFQRCENLDIYLEEERIRVYDSTEIEDSWLSDDDERWRECGCDLCAFETRNRAWYRGETAYSHTENENNNHSNTGWDSQIDTTECPWCGDHVACGSLHRHQHEDCINPPE